MITHVQIIHALQEHSAPYVPDVERALDGIKAQGLEERGWDTSGLPGIIRHETGPEIFAILAGAVELVAAIVHLVSVVKGHHPETIVNVSVTDAKQLEKVLEVIGKAG